MLYYNLKIKDVAIYKNNSIKNSKPDGIVIYISQTKITLSRFIIHKLYVHSLTLTAKRSQCVGEIRTLITLLVN